MIGLELLPIDTWFFRDGTPFALDNSPQENVGSLFPPHPPTVVGALRAAMARSNGWDGRSAWSSDIREVLGDGPEDLGRVSVDGPFLLHHEEPLYRMPRHLAGSSDDGRWKPSTFHRLGDETTCDLGRVRLPEPMRETGTKLKTGDRHWLTKHGMNAVRHGCLPNHDDVVSDDSLWSVEPRIGLQRDGATRTAKEGMLYSTRHVRLAPGVSLGARIAGLPADWGIPFGELLPLGGESRLAECGKWNADVSLKVPWERISATGRVAVVALSPVDWGAQVRPGLELSAPFGNARIVSACIDRAQRIGGWDSQARCPVPLRSVLPPGSVLFCEIADRRGFDEAIAAEGLVRIGRRREWGFGLAALGLWPGDDARFA